MGKFKIQDGFWNAYQDIVCDVMLPYQYEIFSNTVNDSDMEESHALRNFSIAAGDEQGEFYGMVFQDSDVAKWLEAVAYSLELKPNKALEKQADDVIKLVGRAQLEDGYLNTYYTTNFLEKRWQNLRDDHELYCAGHFIEAGVAYYEATGKTELLEIVKKLADHIYDVFGKDKKEGIPGHPEIELALIRLYKVTKAHKYLELANYFIDQRGQNPDFYAQEEERRKGTAPFDSGVINTDYSQASRPVREEKDAIGHAVRAVYLYTGMAKSVLETGDKTLVQACERMWDSIVTKRMYITGGIGSSNHGGECFTMDYDLPNDTVYNETCASIALVFFAKEMLKLTNDSKYANVMERALYNNTLSGMQLDGKRFYYTNSLDFNPDYAETVPIQSHIKKERQKWYSCACCPPNLARMITSLDRYVWHEDGNIVYSDLFIGGLFESANAKIKVTTEYPFGDTVVYEVRQCEEGVKLAVRMPMWSSATTFKINGTDCAPKVKNGYAVLDITVGDKIEVKLDNAPKKIYANYNVNDNLGKCAIIAGALTFCFEEIDNGENLNALQINSSSTPEWREFKSDVLGEVKAVKIGGMRLKQSDKLYSLEPLQSEPTELTAIPYYAWGNREKGRMKVWMVER